MPPREWSMAKAQFAAIFGERFIKEFLDDEEVFLDRSGLVVLTCDSASGFVSTPKPGVFEF